MPATKPKAKRTSIRDYRPSPFATDLVQQRTQTLSKGFGSILDSIKSGFRPGRGDSKAWYVRAFKVIGGIFIIACFLYGVILNYIDRANGH